MTAQARTTVWAAALAGPLLLVPLMLKPLAAFALVALIVVVGLAAVSVAYPVALAGLPALVVGLTGSNPFPKGGITLLIFLWTVLAVGIAVARNRLTLPLSTLRSPVAVLSLLLLAWLFVRLPNSPDGTYGGQKLQLFLFVNGGALLAGLVIAQRPRDFRLFMQLMLAMSVASGFVLARQVASGSAQQFSSDRFVIASTYDPIQIARAMGLGLLIALTLVLGASRAWLRTTALLVTPLLTVAFFAAGSRGPLLGLIAGALVLGGLSLQSREARRRLLLIAPVGLVAAVVVGRIVPGQSITRVLSFISGSDTQGEDRITLWHEAWRVFGDHPVFGLGTGGFGSLSDLYNYPHNIVLEVAAELGVVGLILLGAIVWTGGTHAYRSWRSGDRPVEAAFALGLLAYALLNSMFSGDLAGNGQIWLAVGLGGGLGARLPRRSREQVPEQPGLRPQPAGRQDEGSAGAIVAPADGAAVSGVVRLVATPARTGWGVASVRLQISSDGETWRDVPANDEAYDVVVRGGEETRHVAVVRTRRLAEALVAVLQGSGGQVDVRPARSRPWERARRAEATWDTAGIDGPHRVRAVTSDLGGATVVSPPIEVLVDNVAPTVRLAAVEPLLRAEAADDGSGIEAVRFEARRDVAWVALGEVAEPPYELPDAEVRHGEAVRAVAVDRAGNEAATEPTGVGVELSADELAAMAPAQVEAPAQETADEPTRVFAFEARERALRATAEVAARRERRLVELERSLTARAEALDAEEAELTSRQSELEAEAAERLRTAGEREAAVEQREQAVAAAEARAAEREREIGEIGADVAERQRALDERAAALAAAEAEVGRLRAELDRRADAVAEHERGLVAVQEELAEARRAAAERAGELALVEAESAERARAHAEREAALERREQEVGAAEARATEREREAGQVDADVAERQRALDERAAALVAAESEVTRLRAELDRRADAVAERERGLVAAQEELAEARRAAAERAGELALVEAETAERARAHAEREAALERREQAVADAEARATEREREAGQVDADVAERQRALDERAAALVAAESEVTRLRAELDRRADAVAENARDVAATRRELAEAQQAAAARAEELALVEADAAERARAHAERETALERREQEVAAAEARAAERERGAVEADADVAERQRALEERATALVAAEAEVGRLRTELDRRADTVEENERAVAAARQDIAEAHRAAAEAADELARAEAALELRERAVRKVAEAGAAREQRLAEWERQLTARQAELDELREALVPPAPVVASEPVPEPEPEPVVVVPREEPAPVPVAPVVPPAPPAPEPLPAAADGSLRLWDIEQLVAAHPDPDAYVQDEREATLFSLRGFVAVDGTIPDRFRALVDDVFGPLLYDS